MKNQNNSVKSVKSVRKSQKGKRGNQVGAPPKAFRIPNGQFTMATAFSVNKNQCQLSVRKKMDDLVDNGSVIQLVARKQIGGGVGRPKAVFIKKDAFNAKKHTKLGQTPAPVTPRQRVVKKATNVAVSTTESVATPIPVETPAEPVVNQPVKPAHQVEVGELAVA